MPGVNINVPANGSKVAFAGGPPPNTPCHGTTAATTQSMGYQIDGGQYRAINYTLGATTWSLPDLTTTDCPNVNQTYDLTVHAFDGHGNVSNSQSSFTRTA